MGAPETERAKELFSTLNEIFGGRLGYTVAANFDEPQLNRIITLNNQGYSGEYIESIEDIDQVSIRMRKQGKEDITITPAKF